MGHDVLGLNKIMKRSSIIVVGVFTAWIALAGVLRAAQTNVTIVLTNQSQVAGFLVSLSSSNAVVSVGGGQRMTFASNEILFLNLEEIPAAKTSGAGALDGGISNAPAHITLALTNGSSVAGVLVGQSVTNFVVSTAGGQRLDIARGQVSSFKLEAGAAIAPPAAPTNSIAAEFNKPHTEEEMRAMLRTPEGAALLKSICDQYIGPGADPQTKAAAATYFKTVQEFEDGKIGIVELQVSAKTALGKLNANRPQTNGDPQAARLNAYEQILQDFIAQPAPSPVDPVQ
jgi:hypothetical protein